VCLHWGFLMCARHGFTEVSSGRSTCKAENLPQENITKWGNDEARKIEMVS